MQRERLTVERIKRFSCPRSKSQAFLWDEDAQRLAVRVTASGVKSFVFEGKLDRTTIRWTIGKTSNWTLEDARREARRLQTILDRGIDPREQEAAIRAEKAAHKAAIEANRKFTLRALLEAYYDHLERQGKRKFAQAARSAVKVHVLTASPALSEKPAAEITSGDIAGLIRQVRESGKERTAGVLRAIISAAFNCARRAPFDTDLPTSFSGFEITSNPVDVIPTIPVNAGDRTLSRAELRAYMAALNQSPIDQALRLALFSGGQRMAQLVRAEVSDWNADTKTLRLLDPKGKRRQPREHLVPLAPIAAGIVLHFAKQAEAAETGFLFSSAGKTPIHALTPGQRVAEISRAMGGDPFDLRDIRRTAETMLAGLGVSRDIRAQLLSHGISGVQAVHYDRHDYLREKHAALMRWEKHLTRIAAGEDENNVVELRGGAR